MSDPICKRCGQTVTSRNTLGWLYCDTCQLACHPAAEKDFLILPPKRRNKTARDPDINQDITPG